jgi:hypothetical protein
MIYEYHSAVLQSTAREKRLHDACVRGTRVRTRSIRYAPGGAAVPSSSAGDWIFSNAAVTDDSRLPGCVDIRTDGPGVVSTATLAHPVGYGAGHAIDSVTLTFRYLAGYDSGQGDWPVLSLELVDAATGTLLRTVCVVLLLLARAPRGVLMSCRFFVRTSNSVVRTRSTARVHVYVPCLPAEI